MTGDYPVDLYSPAQHVASELEGAAPAALSVSRLAKDYKHPNTGDLARIREHEHRKSDHDAIRWLVEEVLERLEFAGKTPKSQRQLQSENDEYRLLGSYDDLKWEGRKLKRREPDQHAVLRDPFNPQSGEFSENVRKLGNLDGLRESMREFGWIKQLPAISDERGVIIVGHRRLAVAKELDIPPVVTMIHFGTGDGADADRFRLALASNLDAKPFTPDERKRIAEYLYGEREWVMERIAQALNVSQRTVSEDLRGVEATSTRKGAGGRKPKITPEMEEAIHDGRIQGLSPERAVENALPPSADHATIASAMAVAQGDETKTTCVCPNCGAPHERKS